MKVDQLRAQTDEELKSKLLELHREQFNFRMQRATGQLSKPDQLTKLRRDIARVHTVLGERGISV